MPISDEKKKELFEQLKKLAEDNGFKLLEPKWLGDKEEHRFLHIESGKEFKWRPSQLKYFGFPKDLRTKDEYLKELADLATESGFKLQEPKWLGDMEQHWFLHIESGKEFQWTPSNLKQRGFPLTEGQRYLTQEVCRQAFVHIFGGEFQTNRERLKSLHGKALELDGYQEFGEPIPGILAPYAKADKAEVAFNLENLQIAFEYQGHDGHRNDENVMERDRLKVKYCREQRILLVVIDPPAQKKIRDSEYMYAHVTDAIRVAMGQPNLEFPQGFKIELSNWNADKKAHAELNDLATESGFKLQEPKWLGDAEKHRFLHIESGKEFQWTSNQLKHQGFPKLDYEYLKELTDLATESGFKLLEPKWLGDKEKHRFFHIESGDEFKWMPNKLKQRGFPKRFTQSPLPKQSAKEQGPTSVLDQITSQLKALKSGVAPSKVEKQLGMNARAAGQTTKNLAAPTAVPIDPKDLPSQDKLATEKARAANLSAITGPYPGDDAVMNPTPTPSSTPSTIGEPTVDEVDEEQEVEDVRRRMVG